MTELPKGTPCMYEAYFHYLYSTEINWITKPLCGLQKLVTSISGQFRVFGKKNLRRGANQSNSSNV